MRMLVRTAMLTLCVHAGLDAATEKTIGVFAALADNKNQGIVPVPEAIGNGEYPEKNLYWGTADGLKGCFDARKEWRLSDKYDAPAEADILRTRTYRHAAAGVVLRAHAYRGNAIVRCIQDFESAVQLGSYDMVVFIGHNGLMDTALPSPTRAPQQAKTPDCVVLCCKREQYFKARVKAAGGRPILLTTQLMYPGAFILRAIASDWACGSRLSRIRESAGAAYAANQKISQNAAVGVFAKLEE